MTLETIINERADSALKVVFVCLFSAFESVLTPDECLEWGLRFS